MFRRLALACVTIALLQGCPEPPAKPEATTVAAVRDDLAHDASTGLLDLDALVVRHKATDADLLEACIALFGDTTPLRGTLALTRHGTTERVRAGTVGAIAAHVAVQLVAGTPLHMALPPNAPAVLRRGFELRTLEPARRPSEVESSIRGDATAFTAAALALVGNPVKIDVSKLTGPDLALSGNMLRHANVDSVAVELRGDEAIGVILDR